MRIGIPAETHAGETRVAATPETVKKMLAVGHAVMVEQSAGAGPHRRHDAPLASARRAMPTTRPVRAAVPVHDTGSDGPDDRRILR